MFIKTEKKHLASIENHRSSGQQMRLQNLLKLAFSKVNSKKCPGVIPWTPAPGGRGGRGVGWERGRGWGRGGRLGGRERRVIRGGA